MKRYLICLATVFLLCSCSRSHTEVAKDFTENMAKGKIEEAKKYATESTGTMLDFAGGTGNLSVHPDFKFEVIRDSVADNRAWVVFKDGNKEETVQLVKVDGKWLVHFDANSMK
ncbi:hypothetical protein FXV77_05455 [Sphingobacterium phlebotomi]|uniref:DUF4878 domain-containing protein n=1 Tax=Sphingobacterium phlebotomi TaxID=2605433 RepID=A0A5D4HAV3_9SPHI|nr:hypothetical protein [Sphingobacterium phlebotomi]TYR37452.1 hypothetical protein FXV77_05455 [Sphingobacterium phlebotomi]